MKLYIYIKASLSFFIISILNCNDSVSNNVVPGEIVQKTELPIGEINNTSHVESLNSTDVANLSLTTNLQDLKDNSTSIEAEGNNTHEENVTILHLDLDSNGTFLSAIKGLSPNETVEIEFHHSKTENHTQEFYEKIEYTIKNITEEEVDENILLKEILNKTGVTLDGEDTKVQSQANKTIINNTDNKLEKVEIPPLHNDDPSQAPPKTKEDRSTGISISEIPAQTPANASVGAPISSGDVVAPPTPNPEIPQTSSQVNTNPVEDVHTDYEKEFNLTAEMEKLYYQNTNYTDPNQDSEPEPYSEVERVGSGEVYTPTEQEETPETVLRREWEAQVSNFTASDILTVKIKGGQKYVK